MRVFRNRMAFPASVPKTRRPAATRVTSCQLVDNGARAPGDFVGGLLMLESGVRFRFPTPSEEVSALRLERPPSAVGAPARGRRLLVPGALLALAAGSCGGTDIGVTGEEIRLGSFAPLTGEYAALGNVGRAMSAYFDWLNDQGGIHGRRVRLILKDDQNDPAQTPGLVRELLREEQVFAMVGGMSSANCLAVKDDVWNRLVPWVNPGSSAQIWTEPFHAYTFSILPTSITAAKVLARYALTELGVNRIASIAEETPFGDQGQEGYRLGVRAFYEDVAANLPEGVEVRYARISSRPRRPRTDDPVSEGWLEIPASGEGVLWRVQRQDGGRWGRPEAAPEDVGMYRSPKDGAGIESALADFKERRADAIVIWGVAEFGAAVARAVHADPDWNPILLGSFAMADPLAIELAGEALEGTVVASTTPDLSMDTDATRQVREILADYAPDVPFGDYAMLGMSWAQLAAEGMERAGPDLRRIGLLRGLETLDNWQGLLGHPVTFTDENHRGFDAITLKRVENGEFVAISGWLSE